LRFWHKKKHLRTYRKCLILQVPRDRIELPTRGFSVCSEPLLGLIAWYLMLYINLKLIRIPTMFLCAVLPCFIQLSLIIVAKW
jgi:hypothetical protein